MKKLMAAFSPILVLTGIIFFVFRPCLSAGFLNWDDPAHLMQNVFLPLQDLGDAFSIFMHPDTANRTYIPLTVLSFGIEQSLWGLNPYIFHFNNILLHCLAAALVFFLGCRLGLSRKAAFVAALIFAIHPMRVESVAWVTERKDLLFGVFYFGSMLFYLDYIRSGRAVLYIAALVCAVLSILSKPMALSLPFILFLLDWMCARRWSKQVLLEKLPFMLTLWPVAAVTALQQTEQVVWRSGEMLLIVVFASVFYVLNFFSPLGLQMVLLTPRPVVWFAPEYLLSLGILLLLAVSAWFFRRERWVIFAGAFYVLSIFFVWLIAKNTSIIVAERFMYVPCVGFVLMLGAAWDLVFFQEDKNSRRKVWIGWVTAGLLCTIFSVMTFQRCWAWQDSLTFWNETLRENAMDANAYNNRGTALIDDPFIRWKYALDPQERYELARRDFQRAIELAPRDPDAWHNLSAAMFLLGRKEEGQRAKHKAKELGWLAP